jgi:molecular chaperone GrpE
MGKSNGKSEAEALDRERELPPGDSDENPPASPAESSSGAVELSVAEWQKLKAERDTLIDRLARVQAEFDNARKRAAKEQQDFRDFATADAIKSLLPVIDSFDRALQAKSAAADFRSGVELIYKQLQDALAKLGVRPVPAKGEPFDPHYHEAVEMVETSDVPDHQVFEELQRGYKFKDRLLRPAMVRVAKNSGK